MSDLSEDQITVLLIAAKGEPLMPIGRWKPAVEGLVEKGLLRPHRHDGDPTGFFNNYITAAGQAEADRQDTIFADQLREMAVGSNAIGVAQTKARAAGEQIALQLVDLAAFSSKVTGDAQITSLEKWSRVILERALEMIGGS